MNSSCTLPDPRKHLFGAGVLANDLKETGTPIVVFWREFFHRIPPWQCDQLFPQLR
jgi:hypothetical protein